MTAKEITKLDVFEGREIRKTIHNDEWWFVVEDVVLALIDSKNLKQYIQRMKQRDHMTEVSIPSIQPIPSNRHTIH